MSAPTYPVVGDVFWQVTDRVFKTVGMLVSLDLCFDDTCVERRGRFGAFSGLVVGVGDGTGYASDATGSVTDGGELSRSWSVLAVR